MMQILKPTDSAFFAELFSQNPGRAIFGQFIVVRSYLRRHIEPDLSSQHVKLMDFGVLLRRTRAQMPSFMPKQRVR